MSLILLLAKVVYLRMIYFLWRKNKSFAPGSEWRMRREPLCRSQRAVPTKSVLEVSATLPARPRRPEGRALAASERRLERGAAGRRPRGRSGRRERGRAHRGAVAPPGGAGRRGAAAARRGGIFVTAAVLH